MARSRDPAAVEFARRDRAYWARLRLLFAGRPVVQVKDIRVEAGLGTERYDGDDYVWSCYAEKLVRLGYRPVAVRAMSGAVEVLIYVRGPWPEDAAAPAIHPRLLPYLEDGDPLMALLVGRVQRETKLAASARKEAHHGRT